MDIDLGEEINSVDQDEPYIIIVGSPGDETTEYHVIFEREVWWEGRSCYDSIFLLFCVYYNFNVCYVRLLKPILFFFQCVIFNIGAQDCLKNQPQLAKLMSNAKKIH